MRRESNVIAKGKWLSVPARPHRYLSGRALRPLATCFERLLLLLHVGARPMSKTDDS